MIKLMANSQGPDVEMEITLEESDGSVFLGLRFQDDQEGTEQADWCTDDHDQIRAFFNEMRELEDKYRKFEMTTRPALGKRNQSPGGRYITDVGPGNSGPGR